MINGNNLLERLSKTENKTALGQRGWGIRGQRVQGCGGEGMGDASQWWTFTPIITTFNEVKVACRRSLQLAQ